MKYRGSKTEFSAERSAELMEAFAQLATTKASIVLPDIFAEVVNMGSSRFWVSEERAAIVIARIEAGKPLPRMRSTKLAMYREIYRRYSLLRRKHPDQPLWALVEKVIHQPAPSFYMSPFTAKRLYFSHRRHMRDLRTARHATPYTE